MTLPTTIKIIYRNVLFEMFVMNLCNKTVLITGAARGLGAAIAIKLAARGAKLALVDLDKTKLEPMHLKCTELGAYVKSYATNVAQEEEVIRLFKKVIRDFDHLDVLINNAGILRDGLLVKGTKEAITQRMSLEEWQAVIDVNLTGVFLCGREAATHMVTLGSGGCIINMSSISRTGFFGQSNYSASKAGVAALTVVWAQELAKHGIRVNAIAPGLVKTEMVASIKPEILEKMAASIPAERLCDPEEIAHAAIYLLENDYMNGRIIEIDGGLRW
tara:strand:+ start:1819 stop:2640 length:822 start_codon:yes stop_codon:yes gene_type:complete